jgi:hypothetical protein
MSIGPEGVTARINTVDGRTWEDKKWGMIKYITYELYYTFTQYHVV